MTFKQDWNAIRVKCPDGFTYLVGRPTIEDDLASIDVDKFGLGWATERVKFMGGDEIATWFHEQCEDLEYVREKGVIISRPSYKQLLKGERTTCISECDVRFIKA